MWELVAGTLLGLGSALIVSKSDSLRRRADAASYLRLKLEAWADEVERTVEVVEDFADSEDQERLRLLIGASLQDNRPHVGSLFESRLAELMGYTRKLDEKLVNFHEAVTGAEDRFSRISSRHGESAFLKDEAKSEVKWAADSMLAAARHAISATVYLEDLFSAGWAARWNRIKLSAGLYSGPEPGRQLGAAARTSKLMMLEVGQNEDGENDSDEEDSSE